MATVGVRTAATPGMSSGLGLASALTKALVPDPTRELNLRIQQQKLQQQADYQQQMLEFNRQKEANDQALVPFQQRNYDSEIATRAGNLDIAQQKVGPEIVQMGASANASNASALKTMAEQRQLEAQTNARNAYADALGDQRVAALGPVPVHVVQPQTGFPMSADTEGGFASPVPVDVGWDKTQKYNVDSRAARAGAAAIVQLSKDSGDLAKGVNDSAPQTPGAGGLQFKGNELKQQALNHILAVNQRGGPNPDDPNDVTQYNTAISVAFPSNDVVHSGQNGAIGVMHMPSNLPSGIAPPVRQGAADAPAFNEVVPGQKQLSATQQAELPRIQEMGHAAKYLDLVTPGDIPSSFQHLVGAPQSNRAAAAIGNFFSAPDTRTYETKTQQFLAGVMRKETGAAIKDEEYPLFEARFIPAPGDGPEQIKAKASARAAVMKGMVDGVLGGNGKAADVDAFLRQQGLPGMDLNFRDDIVPPSARQAGTVDAEGWRTMPNGVKVREKR